MTHRNEHLAADLSCQVKAYKRIEEAFDRFRGRAKSEKTELTKELNTLRQDYHKSLANVTSLKEKLKKADKAAHDAWVHERLSDVEDHKELDDLRQALKKENDANAMLQDKVNRKSKQVLDLQVQLQAANDRFQASQAEVARLQGQIQKLKQSMAEHKRTIGRLESDVKKLREANSLLVADKTGLAEELARKMADLKKVEKVLATAQHKTTELESALTAEKAINKTLSTQLKDQTEQSNAALAQSNATIVQMMEQIQQLIKTKELDDQRLTDLANQMAQVTKALQTATADDEADDEAMDKYRKTIMELQKTIIELQQTVTELLEVKKMMEQKMGTLQGNDFADEVKIRNLSKKLAELQSQLQNTAQNHCDNEQATQELNKKLQGLQRKVDEVTADDAKDKAMIQSLKDAQEARQKTIEHLESQNALEQQTARDAKAKAAEEAAKRQKLEEEANKAALEREQASKPVLDNDVVSTAPKTLYCCQLMRPRDLPTRLRWWEASRARRGTSTTRPSISTALSP